jgi:hypothetical protein
MLTLSCSGFLTEKLGRLCVGTLFVVKFFLSTFQNYARAMMDRWIHSWGKSEHGDLKKSQVGLMPERIDTSLLFVVLQNFANT